MRLSIVIPALNEEEAIADTVRLCLEAAPRIAEEADIDGVEVIVVDDGSTDRTAQIVESIPGARLIRHPENRGYGAAIQTGFEAASGDLLGFLDADGTCDPRYFAPLCRALIESDADIATGSRLGEGTSMPAIRRLGNRLFAFLINLVSPQRVEDLASGMRVLRRRALPRLDPLPSGLHYTPAMSAKALFDPALRLLEIPIPYAERRGQSKLSVVRDGQRFLRVLGEIALSYRPFVFFGALGLALLAVAAGYAVAPVLDLVHGQRLGEDRIYRVFTIVVLLAAGFQLIGTGLVAEEATAILHPGPRREGAVRRAFCFLLMKNPAATGGFLLFAAVVLTFDSMRSYLAHGRIDEHWIVVVSGGLMVLLAVQILALGALRAVLRMLAARHRARHSAEGSRAASPAAPAATRVESGPKSS